MFNYLLTSGIIHGAILLALCLSPDPMATQGRENIEVNIRNSFKKVDQPPILKKTETSRKYAKLGPGAKSHQKTEKVDMTEYANRLKAIVDPRWVEKIQPYQSKLKHVYEIIILLSVDFHGNVYRVTVKKSSGDQFFDDLAVQTFREIGTIPIPPKSLVKDGIEWSLVF
jgi:TonB family protein